MHTILYDEEVRSRGRDLMRRESENRRIVNRFADYRPIEPIGPVIA